MDEVKFLKLRIEELEAKWASLERSATIPLAIHQSFTERFLGGNAGITPVSRGGSGAQTLSGILKGNGASPFTAIAPLSGNNTLWAAASSGGATTRGLNFTDGVLVSLS